MSLAMSGNNYMKWLVMKTLNIVTPHGFRIELLLDKMEERTMIWGDNWDNLTMDYQIYINNKIVVNLMIAESS
jgi:hypothetical protein